MYKKVLLLAACLISMMLFVSCDSKEEPSKKIRDLEFTVVTQENIPAELLPELESKKKEAFRMTYADREFLYICIGYGQQLSGGYSIMVNEMYLTKEAIYVDTGLLGPTPEEAKIQTPSYPYIVLQTEYIDKSVIFE